MKAIFQDQKKESAVWLKFRISNCLLLAPEMRRSHTNKSVPNFKSRFKHESGPSTAVWEVEKGKLEGKKACLPVFTWLASVWVQSSRMDCKHCGSSGMPKSNLVNSSLGCWKSSTLRSRSLDWTINSRRISTRRRRNTFVSSFDPSLMGKISARTQFYKLRISRIKKKPTHTRTRSAATCHHNPTGMRLLSFFSPSVQNDNMQVSRHHPPPPLCNWCNFSGAQSIVWPILEAKSYFSKINKCEIFISRRSIVIVNLLSSCGGLPIRFGSRCGLFIAMEKSFSSFQDIQPSLKLFLEKSVSSSSSSSPPPFPPSLPSPHLSVATGAKVIQEMKCGFSFLPSCLSHQMHSHTDTYPLALSCLTLGSGFRWNTSERSAMIKNGRNHSLRLSVFLFSDAFDRRKGTFVCVEQLFSLWKKEKQPRAHDEHCAPHLINNRKYDFLIWNNIQWRDCFSCSTLNEISTNDSRKWKGVFSSVRAVD